MLHTLARQFMFNSPSLPRLIIDMLRSYALTLPGPVVAEGNGWASSFFAATLRYLEPNRISGIQTEGLLANELNYLPSGNKTLGLFQWGGLFSKITAIEIEAAMDLLRYTWLWAVFQQYTGFYADYLILNHEFRCAPTHSKPWIDHQKD